MGCEYLDGNDITNIHMTSTRKNGSRAKISKIIV